MTQSGVHFQKLSLAEKAQKLITLSNNHGAMILWRKGSKDKILLRAQNFNRDHFEIFIEGPGAKFLSDTDVLVTFEVNGTKCFGQGKLSHVNEDTYCVVCNGEFFRSERRSSYRLLTYPHHKVYAHFDVGESYEGGNVINLKTKISQTGLFKDFLKLVGEGQDEDGRVVFRVADISTTGMAINLGEYESKFFEKDRVFENTVVDFVGEKFTFPKTRVVYVIDYFAKEKSQRLYKVGFKFDDVDVNLDEQIGKKINNILREGDDVDDFEDFIDT